MPALAGGFGPLPISLKNVPTPAVPGLLDGPDPIVVDKKTAVALGKALFWDTAVGSDGIACASCHFHAGADARTKNQLAPGGKSTAASALSFETTVSGGLGGPNYRLKKSDFPFFQRANTFDTTSPIVFQSDDVVSSAGTFSGSFSSVPTDGSAADVCGRAADAVFHVGTTGTRKVAPRNAPTVINAAFNHRNFWDGRANNVFNGSSPWGDRDPDAGVWVKLDKTTVQKQRLRLINASLASVAVAPPLNDTEMSCRQRSFKDLARKLLDRRPLENQKVHPRDSVLGPLSFSVFGATGAALPGLDTSYRMLIMEAFNRKYWSYAKRDVFGQPSAAGQPAYSQMEANFTLFFGLAIQLYESTLISDDSPFDRSARNADGLPIDLTAAELRGLDQFRNDHCALCHVGPTFSAATVATNAQLAKTHPEAYGNEAFRIVTSNNVVNRFLSNAGSTLSDTGFTSTGVTPAEADIGLGDVDAFGHPLSFSLQYLQYLAGNGAGVYDAPVAAVRPCDFQLPFALNIDGPTAKMFTRAEGILPQAPGTEGCATPSWGYQPTQAAARAELAKTTSARTLAVMSGAFKIPGLRNVELTGPYMHNGGMATLDQVVEFYARGGNVETAGKNFGFVVGSGEMATSAERRADLIAFLKTLTDDRVRYERAPFDHPEIKVPHGHVGDNVSVAPGHELSEQLGQDEFLTIDAVGAEGRNAPILPFDQGLQ
ncbi:cytochrome-c peroxidase [Methylococcus sp. EFPC2]|uniref:cytochrome-c peroxidase n=1 Tax=Methylococcus sp. EFPC2 TaxID=2812648 RepID=UPI001F0880FA|nr:cytochrome c peroxidase [Methylococcus sp. EFPC2]